MGTDQAQERDQQQQNNMMYPNPASQTAIITPGHLNFHQLNSCTYPSSPIGWTGVLHRVRRKISPLSSRLPSCSKAALNEVEAMQPHCASTVLDWS